MNFYIADGGVVCPRYEIASDDEAGAVLARVFPNRQVVGVDVRDIAVGGGSVHCITGQQSR